MQNGNKEKKNADTGWEIKSENNERNENENYYFPW